MRPPPYWFGVLSSILPFVLIILFIIFYCLRIERRSLASMGLRKAGIPANYLVGYAVGTLMITAAVGLSVLLGGETFTGFNAGVSAPYIALMFAHYLVQGMSEEVAFRGYLMAFRMQSGASNLKAPGLPMLSLSILTPRTPCAG